MFHFHNVADAIFFYGLAAYFLLTTWLYRLIIAPTQEDDFHHRAWVVVKQLTAFEFIFLLFFGFIMSSKMLNTALHAIFAGNTYLFNRGILAIMLVFAFSKLGLLVSTAYNPVCRKQIARPFQSRAAKLIFAAVVLLATVFGSAISAIFKAMIYLFAAGAGAGGSSSSGGFFNEEKNYKNGFGWDKHTHYSDMDNPLSADWD